MNKRSSTILLSALFLAVVLATGCASMGGPKVKVQYEQYAPGFKASDFSRFKGKKLVLSPFINQASNTKAWNYSSPDQKVTYETSAQLETYLWYCFEKDLKHIGVRLIDYAAGGPGYRPYHHPYGWWGAPPPASAQAPRGTPEFQLVMTSLTDQEFKFQVLLFKDGETKFQKDYAVNMEPAPTQDVQELGKRAHRLVDLAFTTVLKDRDFQKAF
jgi:hypothetical protein